MPEPGGDLKTVLEGRLGTRILRDRMDRARRETGGLLDGRAILALIADEEAVAERRLSTLSELDPSRPVFTRCVVENIGPVRDFRGRGRPGRLRKLEVADGTAALALTLWDDETGLVEQLGLVRGTAIRILGATLKQGRFGQEIQVGRAGFIVPEEPPPSQAASGPAPAGASGEDSARIDARGVVLASGTSGRGSQKVTTLRLFDGTGDVEVSIPHVLLEPPAGLDRGAEIEIAAAILVREEGRTVLRCDGRSRLKIQ